MADKKTYNDVVNYFNDRNCTLLSKYYKNNKVNLSYIAACGHRQDMSYSNFSKSTGLCRSCSQRSNIIDELLEHNCKLLGKYENNNKPFSYLVNSCGHIQNRSLVSFRKLKRGKCLICNPYVPDPYKYYNKPTILYCVKVDNLYKVGITTKTVEERFKKDISSGVNITIIDTLKFDTGKTAYKFEQGILLKTKQYQYKGVDILRGTDRLR